MKHLPHTLTSTFSTDDLREFSRHSGPFLTVVLPSPSSLDDAAHRLSIRWKNARRAAEQAGWPADRLAEIDALTDAWEHDDGAAFVIAQSIDGTRIDEALMWEVTTASVSIDSQPRLLTMLDNRQRTLPHMVVVADRAGADIVAFDGGVVTASREVEGERLHIHRGHPGGWSQRRFQQRAENTWETNADSVVEAVLEMAAQVQPVVIAVAGDVRAQSLVERGLSEQAEIAVVSVESGDPDGIADETVRIVDDQHARFLREAIETLRESVGRGTALRGDDVVEALQQGRVDTLFVHDIEDHDQGGVKATTGGTRTSPYERFVDRAIAAALDTAASVVVIPNVAELSDGVAATPRW